MHENQQKILSLAKKEDISKLGYREIGRKLDIPNPQSVIHHLEQLKKKGLLYLDSQKRQRVAKPKAFIVNNFFKIPVLGSANCGPAAQVAEQQIQGYLRISQKSLDRSKPTGLIAVKAVGESLNMAKLPGGSIESGDYVVVDCNKQPRNGDYVLSVIDELANFKKFFKEDGEIRLISESTEDIPPIVLHEQDLSTSGYLVNGVVVRVIKK